jgi:hypothetical protein
MRRGVDRAVQGIGIADVPREAAHPARPARSQGLPWLRTACGSSTSGSRISVPGDSAVAAHPHHPGTAQADFVKMHILVITIA